MSAVAPRVEDVVARQFGTRAFTYVTPFRGKDGLDADSLDLVELLVGLENEFGIEIDDDSAAECETVGEAIALVKRLLDRKVAA